MKKIFIGGLPKSVTDEALRDVFSSYGEIIDYVVMKDSQTKESRGFGFVEFSTEEPVNDVLRSRPFIIEGREIEVRRAMPKEITHNTIHDRTKRVFIGGLNYDVDEEALREYYNDKFAQYGHVESVEIKRSRENNQSRGFGFITFDSEDTVDAVLILEPKPTHLGKNCEVKKSQPRKALEPEDYRRSVRNQRRRSTPPRRRLRADDNFNSSHLGAFKEHPRWSRQAMTEREPYPPPQYEYPEHRYYDRSPPRYRDYQAPPIHHPPEYSRNYRDFYYNDQPNYSYNSTSREDYSPNPPSRQVPSYSARQMSNYSPRNTVPYRQYDMSYRDRSDKRFLN